MSKTTHPPDKLDGLLSDYFKAQMPTPWPAAPVPGSAGRAEPSGLLAARTPPANADRGGNRARVTLAASVALLLGTCWFLSRDGQPVHRAPGKPAPGSGPGLIDSGTATMPEAFDSMKKDKAGKTADPMVDFRPPAVKLP